MADGEEAGRGYYDTAAGDNGPPAGGKRRLIREGGGGPPLGSVVMFGPETQEGGTVSTVSPRRMTCDDVFQVVEQSGGDLSWFPPGFRQCGPKRLWLGTLLDGSVLMMMLKYDRERADGSDPY